MKLYYLPGACPLATHIVLEWIGKPYEAQRVTREEMKQAPYLAINPMGAAPALVDGDLTLTQGPAIMEYLVEQNPESGLLGETPRERAETRRWLGACNADLHRTFTLVFSAATYSDDATIQNILIDKSVTKLLSMFSVVDKQLEGRQWLTGKRSIADPYLYTLLRWARVKDLNLSAMQNLMHFYDRMDADAGVQAALKAEGLV